MTSICAGGGTSSPKAGYSDPIYWTTNAISAFFNALPSPWLFDFASYLHPQNIDPATFCATDPPADPGMTATDFVNLLQFAAPALQLQAEFKLAQLFRRYIWYAICECDSGTQPTPPPAPTPPSGLPVVNPPGVGPSYPTGQPCLQGTTRQHVTNANFYTEGNRPIPTGASRCDAQFSFSQSVTTVGFYTVAITFRNSGGSSVGGCSQSVSTTGITTNTPFTVPSTAVTYEVNAGGGGGWTPADMTWQIDWQIYCGTTPDSPVGPIPQPCPPDPISLGLLNQILELVTLIQRQQVPFSYVDGTVHSGLTGSGHVDVQGLIGARLLLTDFGSNTGSIDGDPDTFSNAGWINWSNPDGAMRREFITCSPMVTLPPLAGQFTQIGYTLEPGVELQITELVREA